MKVLLFICVFFAGIILGQSIINSGELSITVTKLAKGVELSSIKKGELELLNISNSKNLFSLDISGINIISEKGWDSVAINNSGANCTVLFTNPINSKISKNLTIIVTINTSGNKSNWDISVTGLDNNTLNEVIFPQLNIKADGNDYFLLPHYSGKLIKNPINNLIDSKLIYPLGWDASMQFSAYYNNNYGIYFGTHDPKASLKTFVTKAQNGGVQYENIIPIPNKSIIGNDWEMPGTFQLELFDGNWFDASQIYREWASNEAEYWPKESLCRNKRQEAIGSIGVWAYYFSEPSYSMSKIENDFTSFAEYFVENNVGIHWYQWNYLDFDNDYPNYFPELSGMGNLVKKLQKESNIFIMPYINGRLFDQDVPNYSTDGFPYATKNSFGITYTQYFNGNTFDVMCPTQEPWQNTLIDASEQLTNRIDCSGIYLDQVCASTPYQCMDANHNHPLGGGNWWREGYNEMFEKIHNTIPENKFVTVEGGCDYLADEVDGILVEGWTTNNLVPAFSVVYAGQVQMIGRATSTGNYHNPAYYCKLSQAFTFGIQPGRASSWIVHDPNADIARPFLKQIATMRYKLREYLSFGRMLKQVEIDGSIPNITSTWVDYGENIDVTISALQHSVWKNKDNDKIVILFSNASMTTALDFSFLFSGTDYGVSGKLSIEKILENSATPIGIEQNTFSLNVSLNPLEVVAYSILPDSLATDVKENETKFTYKLEQNYPNPFNPTTMISFSLPKASNVQLSVYNMLGEKVAELLNGNISAGKHTVNFNAANLASGMYVYRIKADNFVAVKKMLLLK